MILLLAGALVVTAGVGAAVAAQDQFEPNERPGTAAEIEDGTYEGLSVASDGRDYYEFDLAAGETLEVTVEFTHDDGDLDVKLLNSDERQIAGGSSTSDDESFTYTAEEDETVHLMVYGYDYHSNDYSLTVATDGDSGGSDDGDSGSASDDGNSMDGSGDDSSSDDGGDGLPGFGLLVAIGVLAAVGVGAAARDR